MLIYILTLSTGKSYTCEYITLLQSFHSDDTSSTHWYIVQNA